MIGNCGVLVGFAIKPDFVASGGLAVENRRISTSAQSLGTGIPPAAPLSGHYDGVIQPVGDRRQVWNSIALAPSINQLARDIPRDFECFRNRTALRN